MITDLMKNAGRYGELAPYAAMMLEFVKKAEEEKLEAGKYTLRGEEVFALVQCYSTKKKTDARMEAHKAYCDLQYIMEGEEYICWNPVEEMAVSEDRTPGEDILFLTSGAEKGCTLLTPGMFGYYAPWDGHMPCVAVGDVSAPVKKIVFKIRAE